MGWEHFQGSGPSGKLGNRVEGNWIEGNGLGN